MYTIGRTLRACILTEWVVQNYEEIMNLNSKCSYLVCSTCYNENGPKFSSMYSKRAPHMPSIALVILIIAKNGISKTSSNYDELYTTRIGFACRFRICSQNIKLEPT